MRQDSRMVLERALSNGVLVLTMNRPERRNALNRDLFRAIGDAFVGAETDPEVRAIVLTGAGDEAFCAGMDLKAFAAGEPIGPGDGPGTTVFVERCYPKPIVAAVNGAAVAGGFGVMLGCDIIVAAEHATFFDPHTTYGMAACFEPMFMFGQLPWGELCRMSLLGNYERISAQKAMQLGLVSEVVPGDQLMEAATTIARQLASLPAIAVQGTLKSLWAARTMARDQAISMAGTLVEVGNHPDAIAEGQAFFASGGRITPRIR